jgi:molybdopterin-guanine dinucleotide biosynthesis protein A
MGRDKLALEVAGIGLLDRVVEAVWDWTRVVVVGPRRTTRRMVRWTQEEPPGGGPVAALDAGLRAVAPVDTVVLLAADMPFVAQAARRVATALAAAGPTTDAAVAVDPSGQAQFLVAAFRVPALMTAIAAATEGSPHGVAMRRVLARLRWIPVSASANESWDCDTPADLAKAEQLVHR